MPGIRYSTQQYKAYKGITTWVHRNTYAFILLITRLDEAPREGGRRGNRAQSVRIPVGELAAPWPTQNRRAQSAASPAVACPRPG